ncbi:hypothetical protein ACWC9Q_30510 [Streptomyces sp. NPDC001142]
MPERPERPKLPVQFPAYRLHEKMRREVNDSVMGLLAGAGLASHLLHPMVKADVPLSTIFPEISEVTRFNLSIKQAQLILDNSGTHVARMALPYLLALHEDYIKACLGLLSKEGLVTAKKAESTSPSKAHETIEIASGKSFPSSSLTQFHILREMRNCLIHRGGLVDERLINTIESLSRSAEAGWKKQTGNTPRNLKRGDVLGISTGEVVMSLAVSKKLARCANGIVAESLSESTWVDVILDDVEEFGPGIPANADERLRKVEGYTRHYYSATGITRHGLEEGLARMGF